TRSLAPCRRGLGRGVDADLSAGRGEPLSSSASFVGPSFAISPARGENGSRRRQWPRSMTRERLYLFDTTLRDGAQTSGVDFSLDDKIAVAAMLDRLGLDYVEGGYPGANPTDSAFFEAKRTERATFTAFGMTKRAGVSVSNDPGLRALL